MISISCLTFWVQIIPKPLFILLLAAYSKFIGICLHAFYDYRHNVLYRHAEHCAALVNHLAAAVVRKTGILAHDKRLEGEEAVQGIESLLLTGGHLGGNRILLRNIGRLGDSSDNIPGVAGVGPKTATQLLLDYGTLDAIEEIGGGAFISDQKLVLSLDGLQHLRIIGGYAFGGFEDNVYLEKGVLAKSNGELVEKAVRIAKELGREIATPAEAREILGLAPRA